MAGRNKNKKETKHSIELKNEDKTMKIIFDDKGDCKIMLSSVDFEMAFNIPEELTHQVRLMFYDNYKRHHVWKTHNQRKAEILLEHVKTIEDIQISNDIIPIDLSIDILPDIIDLDGKQK